VTGYKKSKSLISAGRPNRYKILHKIVRDTYAYKLKVKPLFGNQSAKWFNYA